MVKEARLLRVLFLVIALSGLADGMIAAVFVVFPASALHLGSAEYGGMVTALGVGSLVGSLLVGPLAKRISPTRFLAVGLLGEGLAYLWAFNSRSLIPILVLFVLSGTPNVGWHVSMQTLLQTEVEERLRGRVFGAYVSTLSLLLLIGNALGSVAAAPLGIVLILSIGSGFMLLAAAVSFVFMRDAPTTVLQPSTGNERENGFVSRE
ncbi:MFS transporter [Dictyobacter formicarum]|uniref:Major facilitator superfamily (MFS) profile domain-containing protein n=1 Tax=Dictyobacter formicarum TaxID=2778368 RepID=A0ABQ3VLH3_9CHLR|nr:MFS transporter [Dictyobacter formicarum]GHO86453.1 hypothetical protein KSZ_44590 [Dictyobacter formicarum]